MNQLPTVSIILPTFNRAKMLPDAVNSIFRQTYTDWELILWDDGSTDSTSQFASQLKDQRISCRYHSNRGKAATLNCAIKEARGQYLAFLDDDDRWLPDKLSRQIALLNSNPDIEMVFTNYLNINLASGKTGEGFKQNRRGLSELKTSSIEDEGQIVEAGFLRAIAKESFIAFDTVVLRKDIIDRIGNFREDLRNGEDFEFWWRLGLSSVVLGFLDSILLTRVKHSDSLSAASIPASINTLKALDACRAQALTSDQPETTVFLRNRYRNAWQNLGFAYALSGDKHKMTQAMRESLKYGFRPGSLRLWLKGLLV